jgi:hypothetical protein
MARLRKLFAVLTLLASVVSVQAMTTFYALAGMTGDTTGGGTIAESNSRAAVELTGPGALQPSQCNSDVTLTGNAYYQVRLNAASSYPVPCHFLIANGDNYSAGGRAKFIAINGVPSFYLWPGWTLTFDRQTVTSPGQTVMIVNTPNGWSGQAGPWMASPGTVNLYSNHVTGNDAWGATDGLSSSQPFATANHAFLFAQREFCFGSVRQTSLVINFAPNLNDSTQLHLPAHDFCGAQGGFGVVFNGATQSVAGAANNGSGLIRLTVPNTSFYKVGAAVAVYDVQGTTEANGSWIIAAIPDSSHLDLANSNYQHGFVASSTATITAGSGIEVTGKDAIQTYFGTVIQIQNLTVQATNTCLSAQAHSYVYLGPGNIWLNCKSNTFVATDDSTIRITASQGMGHAAHNSVVSNSGKIYAIGANADSRPIAFDYIANVRYTCFAWAQGPGIIDLSDITFSSHGYNPSLGTGFKFEADYNGIIKASNGNPNLVFPGANNSTRSNCTVGGHAGTFC